MKNLVLILSTFALAAALFVNPAAAEKQKVVLDRNEYGGRTLETTYEPGDKYYTNVLKEIVSLDDTEKVLSLEHFYKEKFADEKGYFRTIAYYGLDGIVTREEQFYTDKFIRERGGYKAIARYDNREKVKEIESFYSDKFAAEKGYYKTIARYDSEGRVASLDSLYTEKFADDKGYYKTTAYYDEAGKVTRLRSFYTDKFAGQKGFDETVLYYGGAEAAKPEYYLKGRPILDE